MTLKKYKVQLITIAVLTSMHIGSVSAQEACDVDSIIQPAIDAAATDNNCNAEGTFLNAASFVSHADEKCLARVSAGGCLRCLKDELLRDTTIIRLMVKADLLDKSVLAEVRTGLSGLKDDCQAKAPTPTPTPSSSSSSSGDDQSSSDGSQQSSSASSEPHRGDRTPTPTANDNAAISHARELLAAQCPCDSRVTHARYMECVGGLLSRLMNENLLKRDAVVVLYTAANNSSCGTPGSSSSSSSSRSSASSESSSSHV